jgi:hypothetical protein
MSGGGSNSSSDWRPSPSSEGAGKGGAKDPCDVVETTALNSPVKAVLSGLKDGDILDVVYQAGPPQRLVAESQGQIAGSITSPSMLQIIRCISVNDKQYVAIVLSVRGAICQVRIQPK